MYSLSLAALLGTALFIYCTRLIAAAARCVTASSNIIKCQNLRPGGLSISEADHLTHGSTYSLHTTVQKPNKPNQ